MSERLATRRTPSLLDGLNPEQRDAAQHFEGPLLVLAGAGSGKTKTLTVRIANLVQSHGVDPSAILAVTFTNKAAGEMKERIATLLGRDVGGMWVGTFHSFGAWLLRQYATRLGYASRFTIFDGDDSLKTIKRTMERLDVDKDEYPPQMVRAEVSRAKNALRTPDELARQADLTDDRFLREIARIYAAYQHDLREQNAMDFDDLLVKPVELLHGFPDALDRARRRFQFVTIDEYQDTNHAQFELTKLLASQHRNIMVVGDVDQSIYAFRGADITNILEFEKTFPGSKLVRLEKNYRSTGYILEGANAVIENNTARRDKVLRPTREQGEKIKLVSLPTDLDEASWVVDQIEREIADGRSLSDITILYRTNAQSRVLEEALRRRGITYQIVGGLTFYERREVKDALAYLRLVANPADVGAFERCVNYPRRGIGQSSQHKLFAWAREQGISPIEAAARAGEAGLPARAANALRSFAEMIQRLAARATIVPAGRIVEQIITEAGLKEALEAEGREGQDRIENLDALIASAIEFDASEIADSLGEAATNFTDLDFFLQRVALITDVDYHDERAAALTLMTMHAAKGLEFPVVFLCGMEDGLFPHSRAFGDPNGMEEERRLFYVGMTRAEEKLYLTSAGQRRRGGSIDPTEPSQFLAELPRSVVEEIRPYRERARFSGYYAPRQAPRSSPVYMDEFDDQDLPRFVRGEEVEHPTLGSGTIVQIQGFGRDLRVVVDFGEAGRKTLIARSSGLRRGFN